MIEEVLAFVGRPWLIAAAVVAGAVGTKQGRQVTRNAVKSVVKAGTVVGDSLQNATSKVQEEFSDIVAEAKAELSQNGHEHKSESGSKKKAKAASHE